MSGKFSDETCEALWDLTLDGAHDEECGDASFDRWYGLCLNTGIDGAEHAIVHEDTQGFVNYETYGSAPNSSESSERSRSRRKTKTRSRCPWSYSSKPATLRAPWLRFGSFRRQEESCTRSSEVTSIGTFRSVPSRPASLWSKRRRIAAIRRRPAGRVRARSGGRGHGSLARGSTDMRSASNERHE